ncbi:MAG: S9 family peptidase, partial [Ignavibacteria bacterium]|nr:S9 family peptidase [Ignavibacteria bacterium]
SIKDITPYNYNCPAFSTGGGGFAISPDNKFLVYSANPLENKGNNTNTDLWLYNMLTGQTENITKDNTGSDGGAVFSPDGKYIAYKFQRQGGYESDRFILALYDMQTKSRTVLTEDFDNWVTDAVWAPDSKSIFFAGDVLGYTPVFKLDVDTKKYAEVIPSRAVGGFIPSKTGAELYFTSRLMNSPVDIYCQNLKDSKETRLTFHNEEITQKVDFRTPQALWIPGADGKKVHVWLVTPHNFDPAKKYPLIINVHGGPQSQWMDAYRPDAQVYSGYGYIVAFPNPHGSTGYGQSYTAAISGDWGGKVYQDVMMVTDYLAKLPYVDSTRMAAMGWSYGGYMMNWLQGHTKRFKCLASMMGLYNLESFYGTTEELWFPEWDLKGTPWGNPELYEKYSPSKFVKNFATPTLIITGEKDFRVSYTQSMEYFTALKKQNIDARLVIFKNDGHWPSGIKSMPLYYNAHLEWFNKYLGGEPAPYDSKKLIRNMETIK